MSFLVSAAQKTARFAIQWLAAQAPFSALTRVREFLLFDKMHALKKQVELVSFQKLFIKLQE